MNPRNQMVETHDPTTEDGPERPGIPALSDPKFVPTNEAGATYLREDDRVAGIIIDGDAFAIPLNIFWWHEIVNLTGRPGNPTQLTVTHCPLTGSTMVFDREAVDGAEFGVSGLLYLNNLIMYDRASPESLWPQMLAGASCGAKNGTDLTMSPLVEMTWAGWKSLHPGTLVVSDNTGWSRNHQSYPYGSYDNPNNTQVLFDQQVDTRRPPKERALGIPLGSGGLAFPFGILDELGPVAAAQTPTLGGSLVVFWDRSRQAAMAYEASVDGETLTFSTGVDSIIDDQTQTIWRVDGLGLEGPLAGVQLKPVAGVSLELAADGLWGKVPLAQGFVLDGDKRRMFQLQPTIGIQAGPGRLEANAQIPLSGQNLPRGTGFSLGYRVSWGLLPDPAATLADFLGG